LNVFTESAVPSGTLGFVIAVVLSNISMMHFASRKVSRLLNGRTRTATLTDDIFFNRFCNWERFYFAQWPLFDVDPKGEVNFSVKMLSRSSTLRPAKEEIRLKHNKRVVDSYHTFESVANFPS
jgi:hypothetical protein